MQEELAVIALSKIRDQIRRKIIKREENMLCGGSLTANRTLVVVEGSTSELCLDKVCHVLVTTSIMSSEKVNSANRLDTIT